MDTTASAERRADAQRPLSLEHQPGEKRAPEPPGECVAAPGAGGRLLVFGVFGTAFLFVLEGRSQHVAQAGLELIILLPQPPRYRDILPEAGTTFKECDGRHFF